MSLSADAHASAQIKNIIDSLYRVHGRKREDVIRLLGERHGFKTTKSQWEKLLKECGIHKNKTAKDWQIVNRKIESRKRKGKDSNVYQDGQLMLQKKLRKELSRHGHMTIDEKIRQARECTPTTPSRFEIRTPCDQQVFNLMFKNLPILRFQNLQPFGHLSKSIDEIDPDMSALGLLFKKPVQISSTNNGNASMVESVIPHSFLMDEAATSESALLSVDNLNGPVLLNLTFYLTSNNFPGDSSSETIYTLLKTHGRTSVLDTLLSRKDFTAKAVVEKLFRSAIEAGDVLVVKHFLDAGLDPNGHVCRLEDIPDHLSPIQLACITRNTAMVRELIKAHSMVDHPGSGWKSSALVLAISGIYYLQKQDKKKKVISGHKIDEEKQELGDSRAERLGDEDVHDLYDEQMLEKNNDQDTNTDRHDAENLLTLITMLFYAGSRVNPSGDLHTPEPRRDLSSRIQSIFQDGHSPLTAASKFRQLEVVHFLIQNGANVNFITHNGASALQECLYSLEQFRLDVSAKPIAVRNEIFPSCFQSKRIIDVARYLLEAGANANYSCANSFNKKDNRGRNGDFYDPLFSPLDLAVLSQEFSIVELLLSAGSTVTQDSLIAAIDIDNPEIFCLLLDTGGQTSRSTAQHALRNLNHSLKHWPGGTIDLLLGQHQDTETQRIALCRAISHDDLFLFNVIVSGPVTRASLFERTSALVGAIEQSSASSLRQILSLPSSSFPGGSVLSLLGCSVYYSVSELSGFKLRILLEARADVNATPAELGFETALFKAVKIGKEDFVEMLISAGADVNAKSAAGKTALLIAVKKRDPVLVQKLLNAGAALNTQIECSQCTFDVHRPSGDVLVEAVAWGDMGIITLLILNGADVNQPGRGISTISSERHPCRLPLTVAIQTKNWPCVDYLLKQGAIIENPPEIFMTETPLSAAISSKSMLLIQALLKAGAQPGHPLTLRAAVDDLNLFQNLFLELIERGGIPKGATFGRLALGEAIRKRRPEMVKFILQNHVSDVNTYPYQYHDLYQALQTSDATGSVPVGIKLRRESNDSTSPVFSPLQLAVDSESIEITKVLLQHGAHPDSTSNLDHTLHYPTPIQMATCSKNLEMMELLLRHGANPNAVCKRMPDTALQYAAEHGQKTTVDLLIEYGADVNAPPAKGYGATALQFAASGGYLGIAAVLLENKADANAAAAEVNGWTALEGAAAYGRIDMVQLLLNAGAEIRHGAGKAQYERALQYAAYNGHLVLKRLLEEYYG